MNRRFTILAAAVLAAVSVPAAAQQQVAQAAVESGVIMRGTTAAPMSARRPAAPAQRLQVSTVQAPGAVPPASE